MTGQAIDRLTERERDALRLVAQGYNTKQIAARLAVSPGRASKVIDGANRKLGVSSRMDAARLLAGHEQRGVNVIPGIMPPLPDPAMPPATGFLNEGARLSFEVREERLPYGGAADPADFGWPARRQGGRRNDLSIWQRLVWIAALSALGLLGVGSLARGLGSLSDQIILVPSPGP